MSTPKINVTPLIDVLLVLLIIFMVVTPTKPHSFTAKIPGEPAPDNVDPAPDTLVVEVGSDRSVRLNAQPRSATTDDMSAITDSLRDIFRQRAELDPAMRASDTLRRTVFIKAPKALDYGTVAKVVDAVKISGAAPIALQIDRLDQVWKGE